MQFDPGGARRRNWIDPQAYATPRWCITFPGEAERSRPEPEGVSHAFIVGGGKVVEPGHVLPAGAAPRALGRRLRRERRGAVELCVLRPDGQHIGRQDTLGCLDSRTSAERSPPVEPGSGASSVRSSGGRSCRGQRGAAMLYLGPERGPAWVTVFARYGELGGGQRDPVGDSADAVDRLWFASCCGAMQITRLAPKLVDVGPVGKLRHCHLLAARGSRP